MKQILIATTNAHKTQEYRSMLEPLGYTVLCLQDLDEVPEIVENGTSFEENAQIKAEAIAKIYPHAVLADDSGLEVTAMNQAPGIYSARWMGEDTPYSVKNQAIIDHVKDAKDRSCRFVCVIALAEPNKPTQLFRGVIEGEVSPTIIGEEGFGYDPIFFYPPFNTTLANVSETRKNEVSHRGKACQLLLKALAHEKD